MCTCARRVVIGESSKLLNEKHQNSCLFAVYCLGRVRKQWRVKLARRVARICMRTNFERFEVPMAVNMQCTVFWDVAPCSLVRIYGTELRQVPVNKSSYIFFYNLFMLLR
jgi:hypothetical protein